MFKCFIVNAPTIMAMAFAAVEPFLDARTKVPPLLLGSRPVLRPKSYSFFAVIS